MSDVSEGYLVFNDLQVSPYFIVFLFIECIVIQVICRSNRSIISCTLNTHIELLAVIRQVPINDFTIYQSISQQMATHCKDCTECPIGRSLEPCP